MLKLVLSILFALLCVPAFAQQLVVSLVGNAPISGVNPLPVTGNTGLFTYSASNGDIANTGAGDIFCIAGSASKLVLVKGIRVSATATAAAVVIVNIIKRSALGSGGASTTLTDVPSDSENPASGAMVKSYTTSPTPGTAVGAMRSRKVAVGTQGNTATVSESLFQFSPYWDQPLILRNVNENACVNATAAGAGASWAVDIEWSEGAK